MLGTIRDGGMFGEMALIDAAPRMADAIAAKDTTCLIVPKDKFREKLVRNVRAVTESR